MIFGIIGPPEKYTKDHCYADIAHAFTIYANLIMDFYEYAVKVKSTNFCFYNSYIFI